MVKTSYVGKQAEKSVAHELEKRGHVIVAQNWRRPNCEIDIVSRDSSVVFFTEVKYRSSAAQGEGFDYVTPSKHRQMEKAANVWLAENNWTGECQLQAASVSGADYSQVDIVEV